MIKKWLGKLSVVMLLIFGLVMFFYPMLINSSNMFGDLGDTRFVTYVLEHFYKWITHQGLHLFLEYADVLSLREYAGVFGCDVGRNSFVCAV